MSRHRLYLRLVEKTPTSSPDSDRLEAVRKTVESLAEMEWIVLPKLHPRGGFDVSIYVSSAAVGQKWIEMLNAKGYLSVI